MVIDTYHPREARAANDTDELALRSFGFLRLFHAFDKDTAVFGLANPPHSGRVGVTAVTAVTSWHLSSMLVNLKR